MDLRIFKLWIIGMFILLPVIFPLNACAADYFISSSMGLDGNSGMSETEPWKSFDNMNKITLSPGDRVLLKRGDTWNQRLTIRGAGTSEKWVIIGAYGNAELPKPCISLNNSRDDICLLAEDVSVEAPYAKKLEYIQIENLDVRNSRIGMYFRYYLTTMNKGIRIISCDFFNMNCDEVLHSMTDQNTISAELAMIKGGLSSINFDTYKPMDGGGFEYVWPAAIMFGGKSKPVTSSSKNAYKVSEIAISDCIFNECITGVLAWFYNLHPGTGDSVFKSLTSNWLIRNCTITGTINGAFALDSADGGYTGTDSKWGIISNVRVIRGADGLGFPLGTTGAIVQNSRNFLIDRCEFSKVRNNGSPDGCGLDFESNNDNITLSRSVFHSNEGQAILMMKNAFGPNREIKIIGNLFYNNLTNPAGKGYNYDICVWNKDNTNILVKDNIFFSRHINPVSGKKINPISQKPGITYQNNISRKVGEFPLSSYEPDEIFHKYTTDSSEFITLLRSNRFKFELIVLVSGIVVISLMLMYITIIRKRSGNKY